MARGGEVLWFELPVTADAADLTGPGTGIHRLVGRPPAELTATLIDTDDHRLLDWGLELSRVAETGRWVLRAPGWQPVLPAEWTSPQAEDEIPAEVTGWLVPFRRGGILGPRLDVVTQRRRFSLLDAAGRALGELADERVRVSRPSGQLAAFRTVTVTTLGPLADPARAAVLDAFAAVGGSPIEDAPALAVRLGLAHRGDHAPPTAASPIEDFVHDRFETRWRALLRADLAARSVDNGGAGNGAARDGGAGDAAVGDGRGTELRAGVRLLRAELTGLAALLDSAWVEPARRLVDAALADNARPIHRTERWLRILDLLARGADEPPLPVVAGRITGPVLAQELEAVVQSLCDQCRALDEFCDDVRWTRALAVAVRARTLTTLAVGVFGKPAKRLRRRLEPIVTGLEGTVRPDAVSLTRDLHGLTAAEIFEAGRIYERTMLSVDYARDRFLREWPALWDHLRAKTIRPRVSHQAVLS